LQEWALEVEKNRRLLILILLTPNRRRPTVSHLSQDQEVQDTLSQKNPLQSSPAVAAGGWLPVTALQSPSTSTPPPPPPSSSRHSLPARRAPRNLPFPDSVLWEASEIARRCRMESSSGEELEEEFPGHEWITPQSSVNAAYQSQTEKVRFLLPCSALQMFLLHSAQHTVGQWGISPAAVPCYFLLLWSLCGWGCLGLKSRNFGSRPVAMVLWWVISRR
jgi:hypothetical protein